MSKTYDDVLKRIREAEQKKKQTAAQSATSASSQNMASDPVYAALDQYRKNNTSNTTALSDYRNANAGLNRVDTLLYTPGASDAIKRENLVGEASDIVGRAPMQLDHFTNASGYTDGARKSYLDVVGNTQKWAAETEMLGRARSGDASVLDGLDEKSDQYKLYSQLLNLAGFDAATNAFKDPLPKLTTQQNKQLAMAGEIASMQLPGGENKTTPATYQELLDKQRKYPREQAEKDLGIISGYLDGYVSDYSVYEQAEKNLTEYFGGDWSYDTMKGKSASGVPILGQENHPWINESLAKYDAETQTLRDKYAGLNGSFDEYNAYLNALDANREKAEKLAAEQKARDEEFNGKWGDIAEREGYAEYQLPTFQRNQYGGGLTEDEDLLDQILNGIYTQTADTNSFLKGNTDYEKTGYQFLNDEERKKLAFLFTEESPDVAWEYLEDLQPYLWARRSDDKTARVQEWANKNWLNAALASTAARGAAVLSPADAALTAIRAALGEEIDPNDPMFDRSKYGSLMDQTVGNKIAGATPWATLRGYNLPSLAYSGVTSIADSGMAGFLYGGVKYLPEIMLGMRTALSEFQQGLSENDPLFKNISNALAKGTFEGITEHLGLDAMFGNSTSAWKYLLKNVATEPLEEVVNLALGTGYDIVFDNAYKERIDQLLYEGYTPDEARRQYIKELGREGVETVASSVFAALTSGGSGAVNIAVDDRNRGNQISDAQNTDALLTFAENMYDLPPEIQQMVDEERAAHEATKPKETAPVETVDEFDESATQEAEAPAETASEEAVDEFDESTAEAATEAPAASDETTEQKPVEKSGKNKDKVATSSPARLGRIFREVWQRVDEDAKNVLVDTFSAKNVRRMIDEYSDLDRVQPDEPMKDQLAKVTTKAIVDPANMTEEERKMLMSSKSAMHVLDEMTAAIATKKAATDKLDQLSGMLRKGGATAQNPQLQQMIDLPEELTPDGRTLQQYAEEYGKQADIMHDAHNVGQDAGKYAQQFRTAFNYGRDGRNVESILGESNLSYLTKDQIRTAYGLGRDVRVQTAAEQRRVNPTGVTVGNVDRSAIADIKLNQAQHASVSALSRLAKAVGFNLKVVASTANAEGKYTDKNGSWDRTTRTLTIDINAGRVSTKDANYAMMQTAGHELTHYIKQFADSDLYNEYQEFVLGHLSKKMGNKTLDDRIRSTVAGNAKLGKTLTREQAIDEIVADASGDALLALTEADIREMAQTKPTLLRTIGKFFEKWVNRVKARIRMGYEGTTESNAVAKQMEDVADELGRKWVALLKDANVRASESTGELLVTTKQGAVVSAEVAEIMNSDRYEAPDNGLFSVRETDAWAEAHRKEYPNDTNFADNLALIQKFDADVVQDAVLRYLVPHGRVKKTAHGPLRDNIEYVYTFDMDTKCERTYQFLAYRNAVQKKIGRQLTENEARNLIELMRAYGQMIPCTYCYVEGKRMTLADLYLKYIEKNSASALGTARSAEEIFDGVERARTIVSGWLNDRFNITDNYAVDSKYASDSFEGYRDFKMPITEEQAVDELCERYSITDKAAKKVIAGYVAEWVYNRQMDLPMQLVNEDADFRTDTIEQDVLSFHDRATKAAQGGAKARGIEDYEPYVDQVKNISLEDKAYINGMGGIRKHSSNDFQIQNVQDYMLFFMDLAADKRGGIDWMGHTYTKNLDYARIFAPTNDRINVSIAMYGDKSTGIRPNTQEGVDWEELKKVRAKYKNVGAMAMVTNNDQLSLALNSDWIDMIIPFHASGMKRSLYRGLGWLDYTSKQSERVYTKGQMVDMLREIGIPVKASAKAAEVQQLFMENFDIKTVFNEKTGKRIAPHFFPGDTVQHGVLIPGHHNNAQRYFELCREYGVNPRFYGINVEDAKGNLIPITDHPGYLKLIKETARTDTPQEPIVAKFDMDAVNGAMKAFKGYANLSEDAYGIVDEFVNEYVGKNRPFRYLTERAKETQAIIEEMSAQEQAKRDRMRERMLENIQKYGEEGVAENATTGDDGVAYSVRDGVEFIEHKYYSRFIDRLEEQKPGGYIKVGRILGEGVLHDVGLPEADLYFDISKINKALYVDHSDHIDLDVLKQIPQILRDPVVIAQADVADTVNVFGDVVAGNSPVMIGIVITKDRSGRNVINKVRTIHARRDVIKRITDENVLYLHPNKKRTRDWFQARGNVVPLGGTKFGFIRSIARNDPDVNYQIRDPYQLSDREILANTMESVAQNKDELDILQRYKARVAEYGEYQKQLEEINSGIVRMKKEKASRDDIIKEQNRAQILLNKIDKLDRRLAERERTTAIKALVGRERERVRTEQQKSLRERDVAQLTERLDREKTRYAEMKGKYEQELAEQKQKVKDVRAEKNESFAREKYRAEVIKAADKLRTMVTTPTNKERVPEILRKPMGDFLDALDFSSQSMLKGKDDTKNDQKLKDAMDRMHNALANVRKAQEQGAAESGWLDLPDGYVEEFDNLRLKIGNILGMTDHFDTPVNRMDSETLHDLAKAFRILHASINNMNRLIANAKFESARSAAGSTIGALAKLARQKDYNTLMQTAADFLDWKNTVPYYAFKRFGEGGKAIFEALMNGWDKLANNSAEIIEFTEKTYSAKEVREWERKIREVTLSNGETVRMTTAQLMSLYCLAKREQAVGHLLGGGIRVGDIDSKGMAVRQTKNHKLTEADLRTFSGMLTQREREVADALQKYMATQGAKWGNYVSMKRFGYNMFTEEHYFPIKSDQNNLPQKGDVPEQGSDLYRLLNMSATKDLLEGANNALVVDSIFDVFTSHMADMAKYNALGLEILDTLKWINYVEKTNNPDGTVDTLSVREKMESAYGAEARNYVMEFLKNLNGETEGGREDKLVSKAISNYKVAATAANLRVALLQITSMPRAAYVINPKYLVAGLVKWNAGGWKNSKKAQENVGIAKWKAMGFYDTNISRNMRELIKHDESVMDKTRDYSMKLAEWGDAWTMGVLYGAVEAELAAKGIREGHSDFKRQMNNRMREIIYQTQVVDSTMTRSHLMRQKGLMSQLTSFMSEPTLTMNLINDALFDARMKIRSGEGNWFPGVLKQTAKAFGVTGFGLAASAVIEALMTGFRDDDEYEKSLEKFMDALIGDYSDAETFGQKMTEFWSSSIGGNLNLLSNIPIVKQYLEAAQGNSVELNFFDWIKESKTGVETLYKAIMEDGSIADYYRGVYKIATGASQATGIAVSGAMRDLVAMYNTFVARPAGWRRIQTYDNTEREAAQAIFDAENAGDTALAQRYRERFKLYGMDEKKFNDAMSKLAQEAYIGGEISEARASEVMKASGKSNRNTDKALSAADYEIATGLEHGDMKDDFVDGTITEAQARECLKKYNGMRDREIDEKLGEWKYEKDTGNTYSGMKDDFLDGVISKDQAIGYRVKYGGAERGDAEETVMKWQYEKDTGLVYSELKLDYEDGVITESQLRNALAKYGGKDPEKVEETVSNYDYQIATGRTTTAPKYWRIAYAFDTGKDADTLIQQAFDDIMYGGEKTKSWKQARSQIASSLAAYYKKDYLAIKGTAKGAQMLERILDLYEKIGYSRSYQTQYIEENWTDD